MLSASSIDICACTTKERKNKTSEAMTLGRGAMAIVSGLSELSSRMQRL
jgi:hypothetical protein